jgi:PAS domain S-box-containing protein
MKTVDLTRKLQLGFGITIAILIALTFVSYQLVVASTTGDVMVRHTHVVIEKLAALLSATQDIETEERGFLLAGDERFLGSYQAGQANAPAILSEIATLIADNPDQQHRVARLTTLIGQKIQFGDQVILLRRETGVQAAFDRVAGGDGLRLMDEIRLLIREMEDDEQKLLAERDAIASRNANRIKVLLTLGILGAIVVLGLVGWMISRDLAARRKSEQEVRESEERFRVLIDGVRDYAIVMLDREGRVATWNVGAENINGYHSAEVIGQSFAAFYSPEDIQHGKPEEALIAASTSGRHEEDGWQMRKDGSRFWNNAVLTALRDPAGSLLGFSMVSRDISEQKRHLDAMERKTAELKRSNDELEQFAYVASHDLQEPLRMVASYTQLLAKRYAGRLDADAHEFIGFAVDGANRMQRLIQDLLAYSRVGSQGKELCPTSSEDALTRALVNLQPAIEKSGALVTHDPLPTVLGDDLQVTQLFQNLVGNAVKYHGLHAPKIHIGSGKNGNREWTFAISDNGIGIPSEHFDRIFVMFQRLHGRDEFGGTGIGLTVCKKIVERHGGRMWVESKPGHGSTFRFTMPELEVT